MNEDERQAEDGGVDDALVARDIFVLAFLAQKAGKHTLARAAWHKYVTIRPTDPRGHHNLATCLRNAHEDTAALASFEQAFALKPSLGEAAANAAGILIRNGDCDRACELCFRALEGDPECSVALYNLNVALRMAGRQNEAIAFSWRWILRRLPRAMSAGERLPAVAATFAGPAKATDAVDAVDAADVGVDDEVAMGCPPAKEGEQVLHASAAANVSRKLRCTVNSSGFHGGTWWAHILVSAVRFGLTHRLQQDMGSDRVVRRRASLGVYDTEVDDRLIHVR